MTLMMLSAFIVVRYRCLLSLERTRVVYVHT